MGCPVRSSMEVVELGYSSLGRRVVIDKNAYESDGIIVSLQAEAPQCFPGNPRKRSLQNDDRRTWQAGGGPGGPQ